MEFGPIYSREFLLYHYYFFLLFILCYVLISGSMSVLLYLSVCKMCVKIKALFSMYKCISVSVYDRGFTISSTFVNKLIMALNRDEVN